MSSVDINCPYCNDTFELSDISSIGERLINCKNCDTEFEINIECELSCDHNIDIDSQEFKNKQKQALEWINERDGGLFIITNNDFSYFYIECDSGNGVISGIGNATRFRTEESTKHAMNWFNLRGMDWYKVVTLKEALSKLENKNG